MLFSSPPGDIFYRASINMECFNNHALTGIFFNFKPDYLRVTLPSLTSLFNYRYIQPVLLLDDFITYLIIDYFSNYARATVMQCKKNGLTSLRNAYSDISSPINKADSLTATLVRLFFSNNPATLQSRSKLRRTLHTGSYFQRMRLHYRHISRRLVTATVLLQSVHFIFRGHRRHPSTVPASYRSLLLVPSQAAV